MIHRSIIVGHPDFYWDHQDFKKGRDRHHVWEFCSRDGPMKDFDSSLTHHVEWIRDLSGLIKY